MTKAFLKFPPARRSFLPKINSRRMGGAQNFRSAAYKSDGSDDKAEMDELLKTIDKRFESQLEKRATKEEIAAIKLSQIPELKEFPLEALRALASETDGALAVLTRQGLEISRLRTSFDSAPKDMSLRSQIKSWLESANEEGGTETVSTVIKKIQSRQKSDLKPLEIEMNYRVNSPMLPANTLGGSAYLPRPEFAPGIVDLVRPDYTFWSYIKKGTTGSAAYVWTNKKNPLGAAAFIAPGVYKPGISFTIETEISNAKKIAASEKVAIELLDDIDGMVSWIEDELLYQVYQKASLTLMTGVLDSNTPAGIQTLSTGFAFNTLGLETTNANNWDVIRAGVAQLKAGNFKGTVTAFLNPIDYANMVMTKAQNQGQLFIPPVTGATIVEDNNVAVGFVQIAILDYYKIKIYKGFTMMWGLENDDFTKNLRTVIGEMRIHQMFSSNHIGSLLYDTFADGIAQLAPGP